MLRALLIAFALLLPGASLAQGDDNPGDAPIVIIGVVDPNGGGGGSRSSRQETWTGSFNLIAWRIEGSEETNERELRVEIPDQTEQSLGKWARVFPASRLVRFSIREPVKPGKFMDSAVLKAPLPPKTDWQILALAHAILNPPPFVDEELGTFRPHRRFPDWFEQERQWLGTKVSVTLMDLGRNAGSNPAQLAKAADTLRALDKTAASWDARMRAAIVEDYYTLWMETWREDQPMITREAFGKRFIPDGATFYPDGGFRFYYRDGELFYGHVMEVSGSIDEGISDISLMG